MSVGHLEHLRGRLVQAHVPEQLHDGLIHYIASRRRVGHFLTAVLSNDLRGACGRADEICQANLHCIVRFLVNYAPGDCWGTPEHVEAWLNDPQPAPEVFE